MKRALVALAEGVEELEAVAVIDILRRAGWQVVAAGVTPAPITASRGVKLLPDCAWETALQDDFDVLVIPGGNGGTQVLRQHASVLDTIRRYYAAGKPVAAICAGPLVLQAAGVLKGVTVTCHPGAAAELTEATRREARVVTDKGIITSQGPGTSIEFAMTILAQVEGAGAVQRVAPGLILPH